jgi:hypothetical protein
MRLMPRSICKISMAGIGAVLLATAAMAAEAPAGMVLVAHNASVDRATATLGANVYSGDSLNTSAGGTLRLRIGAGQLYMMAMTDATLSNDESRVAAHIVRGTAGFSATAADPLELDTPVGILRPANNSRAFGQVTIFGPNRVVITSYEGTLLLTRNGESKTIEPGKSYSVSVAGAPGAAPAPQTPQGYPGGGGSGNSNNHLGFDAVVIGGTAVAGYVIYTVMSESDSNPSN